MTSPDLMPVGVPELTRLSRGDHQDPHSILGPHAWDGGVTIRVLAPRADGVIVRGHWGETRLEREFRDVFAGVLPVPDPPGTRSCPSTGANRSSWRTLIASVPRSATLTCT